MGGELSCTPGKRGGGTGGARACVGKEEPPVKAKRVFLYLLISLHSLTDHFSRQYPILQTTKFKRLDTIRESKTLLKLFVSCSFFYDSKPRVWRFSI